MSDPTFILLKEGLGWIDQVHQAKLLGAVVKNYLSPLDDSFPERPLSYNRLVLNSIDLDDFIVSQTSQKKTSTSLSLKTFFELRAQKDVLKGFHLEGKRILVRRLQGHTAFWTRMTDNEDDFVSVLESWKSEKKKPYWVTGLLMCQDVKLAATESEAKDRLAKGEIPIGTFADLAAKAHGVPLNLADFPNVVGERQRASLQSQCFAASSKDTKIFALQLQRVILSKKGKPSVQDKPPKNRQLGGSMDIDDPIFEELDEDEWTELVGDESE